MYDSYLPGKLIILRAGLMSYDNFVTTLNIYEIIRSSPHLLWTLGEVLIVPETILGVLQVSQYLGSTEIK